MNMWQQQQHWIRHNDETILQQRSCSSNLLFGWGCTTRCCVPRVADRGYLTSCRLHRINGRCHGHQRPGASRFAIHVGGTWMTREWKPLKEIQLSTRFVGTTKKHFHLNAQTMYREGASAQIEREMEGYKFWGISECRWTGARRMRTASDQRIIYSGNEELHEEGVVIMISRQAVKSLM